MTWGGEDPRAAIGEMFYRLSTSGWIWEDGPNSLAYSTWDPHADAERARTSYESIKNHAAVKKRRAEACKRWRQRKKESRQKSGTSSEKSKEFALGVAEDVQ